MGVIVSVRYILDVINVKVLLVMMGIARGLERSRTIDVYETPFHIPTECPARLEAIIEAIKEELAVKGLKYAVKIYDQVIQIDPYYDEESGVPIEAFPDLLLEDEEDDEEEGMEASDVEEAYDVYDEWDQYGESFEDYVCRILCDENYHLEVYKDE